MSLSGALTRILVRRGVPEDSRALRLAVLAAALWAFAAVGWATGLAVQAGLAAVAVTAGHWYSMATRHQPSTRRSAFLGFLIACAAFMMLADLFTAAFGGRLPQAQFGLAVQAITSFELRTRANLYSTLAHSLLVLYIAADASFSPMLGLFLLGYAVAALAFLFLATFEDSRAGVDEGPVLSAVARPRVLGPLAVAGGLFMLLTPVVFLAIPRVPNDQLLNPAMVSLGVPWAVRAQTVTPLFPFVQLSPNGRSGLNPTMDLAWRGHPDPSVVLQVRSEAASYWRGLVFDRYENSTWTSTAPRRFGRLAGDGATRVAFEGAPPPGRRYVQTFFAVQDQPDVLFGGYYPVLVQLLARGVTTAPSDGTVFAEQGLPAGTAYSVLSTISAATPDDLRRDAARSENPRHYQLPALPGRVTALAREITRGAATDYDRALAIESYLRKTYPYDLNLAPLPLGVDAVDWFLFEERRGFCQQFASAMVVLARAAGLPARVVTGYLPGEYSPLVGAFVVRARDAHSWAEVRFQRSGWVPFDPTPVLDAPLRSPQQQGIWLGPQFTLPSLRTMVGTIGGAFGSVAGVIGPVGGALLAGLIAALPWLALWLAAGALAWLGRRRLRRLVLRRTGRLDPDMERRAAVLAAFAELEGVLARRGVPRREAAVTVREYLAGMDEQQRSPAVRRIVEAAETAAYGTGPLPPELPGQVTVDLRTVKESL